MNSKPNPVGIFPALHGEFFGGSIPPQGPKQSKTFIMNWISVNFEGWAGSFIVVRSFIGETRRYYGYSKKEAERRYREEFGLIGKHLVKINS